MVLTCRRPLPLGTSGRRPVLGESVLGPGATVYGCILVWIGNSRRCRSRSPCWSHTWRSTFFHSLKDCGSRDGPVRMTVVALLFSAITLPAWSQSTADAAPINEQVVALYGQD